MRDGWVETTFRAFALLEKGISYKSSELCDEGEGMPFINLKSIDRGGGYRSDGLKWYSGKFKSSQVVEPGDLILCCTDLTKQKAILGYPILVPAIGYSRFCISLDLAKILVDEKMILKSFLFLLLQDRRMREFMQSRSSGTTVMHLKTSEVPDVQVALPPLPEQKRIVDLISSVDSYIEALQQQLESAKRSRNAVLHELLTAGSDDWVETTLGEITDLVRGPFGGSLKKEIFVKEGFAVYEQQHAIYGDFSTIRYRVSSEKFDEMKRFSLVPGDLIMSCSGTMGKVRIVPKEADPGIINQALLKIKPKSNLSSDFLYLWMQSDDFIRQIEMNSGGGALQNVSSVKMLKGIKLRVPGLLEQERIIGIISMIDEVIIKTELAICEAKNLRSGLLSNLLNGDHEIPSSYDKVMGAA